MYTGVRFELIHDGVRPAVQPDESKVHYLRFRIAAVASIYESLGVFFTSGSPGSWIQNNCNSTSNHRNNTYINHL